MVNIDPDVIPDNVEEIMINGNPISAILGRTFASKRNCRVLSLAYNEIHNLDVQAFELITSLQELYLNHNLLKELKKGTFDTINTFSPKLWKVEMQDNLLTTLRLGLFSTVIGSLTYLNIRNNPLAAISYELMQELAPIEVVGIPEGK